MQEVGILALRALAGGGLVVAFSLISTVVRPKAFAGLFASAPSVAVASLAVTVLFEGASAARRSSIGMVAGAIGMAACCAIAVGAIPRLKSLWGSVVAVGGWAVVALGLYWAVFIGAH